MDWRKVSASKLLELITAAMDLFNILPNIKPSVGEIDIRKCREWTEQFGLEGA
jgi:vacuolar protein-sorting-associated protein 4